MRKVYPEGHPAAQYHIFTTPQHVYRAILEHDPYPVRAIIVQTGEPLLDYGGARRAKEALDSDELELLVVMDLWLTPTAQLADYALPAADFLERPDLAMEWGLKGDFFAVGQQVVDPLYDRRNDYQLWADLGRRLLDPARWPERIEDMMDRFLAPSGRTFQEWADGDRNWHRPTRTWKTYEQRGFATASGKVELIPSLFTEFGVEARPIYTGPPYAIPDVDNEADYPLQMITGTREAALQGSTLRQARRSREMFPDPIVEIHPDTAARHGIADGDWVVIERPEGSIRQRARLTDGIESGTIGVAGYWWDPTRKPGPDLSGVWESNANAITPSDIKLTSFSGDQHLRGLRCRIRPEVAAGPTPTSQGTPTSR
jgi:thiosulfate reductase/polysulfide reductase chain A